MLKYNHISGLPLSECNGQKIAKYDFNHGKFCLSSNAADLYNWAQIAFDITFWDMSYKKIPYDVKAWSLEYQIEALRLIKNVVDLRWIINDSMSDDYSRFSCVTVKCRPILKIIAEIDKKDNFHYAEISIGMLGKANLTDHFFGENIEAGIELANEIYPGCTAKIYESIRTLWEDFANR